MFGLRVTPRLGPQPEHQERMQTLNLIQTPIQTLILRLYRSLRLTRCQTLARIRHREQL